MKKNPLILIIMLCTLLFPQAAFANMAAPADPDIGSTITFEKNDAVTVESEVLDITVTGAQAQIVATYEMKNTSAENVNLSSMFLAPNMAYSDTQVTVDGENVDFIAENYALNYSTKITTEDWRYVILSDEEIASTQPQKTVDSVTFDLAFEPEETHTVMVSYLYALGGYPDYDFNVKRGEIEYYLAPAAMWKDFSNLTINLYLDEDMPILKSSNLDFQKVGTRTYQYTSDTLPDENLRITIDENWWQTIFSSLRSPYLPFALLLISPLIIIVVVCVVIWRIRKKKQQKKKS